LRSFFGAVTSLRESKKGKELDLRFLSVPDFHPKNSFFFSKINN